MSAIKSAPRKLAPIAPAAELRPFLDSLAEMVANAVERDVRALTVIRQTKRAAAPNPKKASPK